MQNEPHLFCTELTTDERKYMVTLRENSFKNIFPKLYK